LRDADYKHSLAHEAQNNVQENVQSFLLPYQELLLLYLQRLLLPHDLLERVFTDFIRSLLNYLFLLMGMMLVAFFN
jgi:hypothetical protein